MEPNQEKEVLLQWAKTFNTRTVRIDRTPISRFVNESWHADLTKYWNLALLSRASNRYPTYSEIAKKLVFKVRVKIERSIAKSIELSIGEGSIALEDLFDSSFFSESIKQGLSLRMPLSSCNPTSNCHWSCYAHDGMDAGRYPVIKGAINGVVARLYEDGSDALRNRILSLLQRTTETAIRKSLRERDKADFRREPRIRFSHVGEVAEFPQFANAFASMVNKLSNGEVQCVVYTRHQNACLLDEKLFVVNFTLDRDSEERRSWVPNNARLVYTAWDGVCDNTVAVNFLEHHRFSHAAVRKAGSICPVTLPETQLKTCDAAKCDLCFRKTN